MRLRKTLMTVATLSMAGRGVAAAQTIRGVTVDAADRSVSGVVVFMLDSLSNVVARALSSETGEFRVIGPRAGTYRLRTMRIGYRPATTDGIVTLLGGEVTKRVALSGVLVSLDTVRVVDRNSCRVMSDSSAAATFAVLEQVRTALSAAQLTLAAGRSINATTMAYDRELEADGRKVVHQTSRMTTQYVTQPWRAITPDSAHRGGFVFVGGDNSVTYFAPSIDILLSDAFAEDHCFRLVADRKQPTSVGVAFEPSPNRKSFSEIKGTLWVDKKSAELQRLDYRYVNISNEQQSAGAGGGVAFARLKNGGWVISQWDIRMPVLELMVRSSTFGGSQARVAAIQVAGGEIVMATRASGGVVDTLWMRPPLVMNGSVVDSVGSNAIPKAHVDVLGAGVGDTTDSRGRFAIHGLLPGTYVLETRTPDLDALGATVQSTITFDDTATAYRIRVPTAAQLISGLCAGNSLTKNESVIVGRVYQRGDTLPAVGARVLAEWTVIALHDEHGVTASRTGRKLEGKTWTDGSYRLCGVPANTNATVSAATDAAASVPTPVFTGTRVVRTDLTLDRAAATLASFTGKVLVDSTKTPIADAEIFFPELSKLARSSADGAFRIDEIPPGERHVIVRHIGYGNLDTKLTFQPKQTVDRQVFLSKATVLDSVVVSEKRIDPLLADFERNRRIGVGHFMDRAELANQPGVRLSRLVAQWPGILLALGTGGRVYITGTRRAPALCPPGPPSRDCYESHGWYYPSAGEAAQGIKVACYSQVYINGVLMNAGNPTRPFEASALFADQLEAVEWYAGPSETPSHYQGLQSGCGVLAIQTRRTP
jgi:hypothetical protein